jgi:hypothetical protein
LHKEINGETRAVILLGETHIKDDIDYQMGQRILKHFPVRALEGFQGKRWYHRLFMAQYKPLLEILQKFNKWKGSTITEAKTLPTESNSSLKIANLEDGHHYPIDETIFFHTMNLPVYFLVANTAFPLTELTVPDHVESVLHSLHGNVNFGFVALAVGQWYLSGLKYMVNVEEKYKSSSPIPGFLHGLLRGRNLTMTARVNDLINDAEVDFNAPALAIVGRAHVPGMKKLLMEKYGFQITESKPE